VVQAANLTGGPTMVIIKTKNGWVYVDTGLRGDNGIKFNDKFRQFKSRVEKHWEDHHSRGYTTPTGQ
jgi:hypothetical protein